MGTFYSGAAFPSSYFGVLFYGDYAQGWIKSVKLTARRAQPGAALVSFTVTDDCGAWKTFVGSGSATGF